jgi:hypothetical protein
MFLGDLLRVTIANRIVLFDEDGCTIGSFTTETVPEDFKRCCVMEIIIPSDTKWFSNNGTMFVNIKYGGF